MDDLTNVRQLLELGFPAVVLVMLWLMWSEYRKRVQAHIEDLREIAGLRTSLPQPIKEDGSRALLAGD